LAIDAQVLDRLTSLLAARSAELGIATAGQPRKLTPPGVEPVTGPRRSEIPGTIAVRIGKCLYY
jgi:hypothetical protein